MEVIVEGKVLKVRGFKSKKGKQLYRIYVDRGDEIDVFIVDKEVKEEEVVKLSIVLPSKLMFGRVVV